MILRASVQADDKVFPHKLIWPPRREAEMPKKLQQHFLNDLGRGVYP